MIVFLISLIICIFTHELGHLIVAKKCGCTVDIFSIGFGKPFYRKEIGNTIYQIAPVILGGYCKLKDEVKSSNEGDAFTNLIYRKKVMITIAGCLVNIISGLICILIGTKLNIWNLVYFGFISTSLGVTNLLPIPALDGSYLYLVWLEKYMGKEKGYTLMEKLINIGFKILMILNILCIPYIIMNWRKF